MFRFAIRRGAPGSGRCFCLAAADETLEPALLTDESKVERHLCVMLIWVVEAVIH
jgi:hypothetical protein